MILGNRIMLSIIVINMILKSLIIALVTWVGEDT
jgi:hypothetical protein